jgi:hypothetical protein
LFEVLDNAGVLAGDWTCFPKNAGFCCNSGRTDGSGVFDGAIDGINKMKGLRSMTHGAMDGRELKGLQSMKLDARLFLSHAGRWSDGVSVRNNDGLFVITRWLPGPN